MNKKILLTTLAVFLFCLTQIVSAQISPKIIGGKIADPNKWPWMAGIATQGKTDFEGQFCGASLIDKNWVLTAAHCVTDDEKEKNDLDVIINRARFDTTSGERIAVDKIIVHPLYDNITLDNDIALIKLQQPSSFKPITVISSDSTLDKPGTDALTLGWGNISTVNKIYPKVLYQVGLPIKTDSRCSSVLPGFTGNMLCAGAGLGVKDTCQGDSGGPLIVFNKATLSWHQVGITSWGNGCAKEGFSGVYTRLKNYNTFISDTICSPSETPKPVSLSLAVNAKKVTASWSKSSNATGYRLYFAPFPQAEPIQYIDVGGKTQFSAELPLGSAYFVAIVSYKGNCLSKGADIEYSNIEHFKIK